MKAATLLALVIPLVFGGAVAGGDVARAAAAESTAPATRVEVVRIRAATIVVPDARRVAGWYQQAFDYRIVEQGRLDAALARSWGSPRVAGRRYLVLAPQGSPDVLLRIVQAAPDAPPPSRRPSFGWSSLELIVSDLDAVRERLRSMDVEVFREPASLGPPFESIFAMQIRGPAAQTINLTLDKGDPARSNLPQAHSLVDRIFLVGLNGPDLEAQRAFYTQRLGLRGFPNYDQPIPSLAKELGLASDHVFQMALARAAQKGNTLEFHGLPPPAAARPALPGDLPAGVAIVTLEATGIVEASLPWITSLQARPGKIYGDRPVATMFGPAGERIELVAPGDRGQRER